MQNPSPIKSEDVARLLQKASETEVPEESLRKRINDAVLGFYKADVLRLEEIEDIARMVCEFTCRENLPQSLIRSRTHFQVLEGVRMTHRSPTSFMLLAHKINEAVGLGARVRVDVLGEHGTTELRLLLDHMVCVSREYSFKQMSGIAAGILGGGPAARALLSSFPAEQNALSVLKMPFGATFTTTENASNEKASVPESVPVVSITSEPGDALNMLTRALLISVLRGSTSFASAQASLAGGFQARGFDSGSVAGSDWSQSDIEQRRQKQRVAFDFLMAMPSVLVSAHNRTSHYQLVMIALGLNDEAGHQVFGDAGWAEVCTIRLELMRAEPANQAGLKFGIVRLFARLGHFFRRISQR